MMKTILLALTLAIASITGSFAAQITISGKLSLYDGGSPEGASVTITDQNGLLDSKTSLVSSDGAYSCTLEISSWLIPTRLYDITYEKQGYKTEILTKVISESFVIERVVLVPTGTDIYKPYLNLIALSSQEKNIVAWERDKDLGIDYYIVKKKNSNGTFDSIGNVAYNAEYSIFIDESTNRTAEEYYRIQAVFSNKSVSLPSNTRKTFQLKLSEDDYFLTNALEISFDLSVFDGIDYPLNYIENIELLRSKDGEHFVRHAKKQISELSYENVLTLLPSDTLRMSGTYTYKAIITFVDTCFPAILKSDSGPFSQSISNLAESIVSSEQVGEEPEPTTTSFINKSEIVALYPTPAEKLFTAESQGKSQINIYSLTGELVVEQWFDSKISFETASFEKGIYLVSIKNCNGTYSFRQVIK